MTALSVEEWLRQNGGPRRFPAGTSATPDAARNYLVSKGYDVQLQGWKSAGIATVKKVGAKGPGRRMKMRQLFELVDELRRADGLDPILRGD